MAILKVPVRWYGGAGYYQGDHSSDGHCYDDLELELERTAFMIVDSDCGSGNSYVEEGIAPALQAARQLGMNVLFIHNDFSLVDEPGSTKRSTAPSSTITASSCCAIAPTRANTPTQRMRVCRKAVGCAKLCCAILSMSWVIRRRRRNLQRCVRGVRRIERGRRKGG